MKLFGDSKYRILRQDRIGKYYISSIWKGTYTNVTGQPLIFETIKATYPKRRKIFFNAVCIQTATEREAMELHSALFIKYSKLWKNYPRKYKNKMIM